MPEYLDTGGDGCSPQDYFFKQSQEVITIDDDNNRVGINNTNPQYDLDVNGTIATSNLIAVTVSAVEGNFDDILLSNVSLSNVKPDELHPNGYIDFSWMKADPLSNVVFTDKWGSFGNTTGALVGGAQAALLAGTWYSAPFVSPAGAEGFSGAEQTGGVTAGDDGYQLGVEIGKEWGIYVAGLEGGRDAGDAAQLAVENGIEQGLIAGNELEVGALATATAITTIGTTGSLPLGQGWYSKGLPFGQKIGKLAGMVAGLKVKSHATSNAFYPLIDNIEWGSNKATWSSNASSYGSNTARWGSNTADWSSNIADWSSNTSLWASNVARWSSNTADWSSNTALWSSNTTHGASNVAHWSSNTAASASNQAYTDRYWTNTLAVIHTNSNVGIGTETTNSKLDIEGAVHIGGESISPQLKQGLYLNWNNGTTKVINNRGVSGGDIIFETYNGLGLERTLMKLDNMGYVGIGTNTPSSTLDVSGTANATNIKENEVLLLTKYALSNSLLAGKTRIDNLTSQVTTAQNTANTANTAAVVAQSTAVAAQTTATAAGVAAAAAQISADLAQTTANAAGVAAAAAMTTATGAAAGAGAAQTTANNGLEKAGWGCNTAIYSSNALSNYALSNALSNYALSNALSNYALSNTLSNYALSNALSNYALSNALSNYALSNALSKYALSNALSNYALSNALSNYALSNTLSNYALSNALSNYVLSNAYTTYSNWLSPYATRMGTTEYSSNAITVLNNQPFTFSNANVIATCNVSAPSVNIGTTTFTSNAITMANKATDTYTIAASNLLIDANILTFANKTPRIVCSNSGILNARSIIFRNQNFNTPNQSSTTLGFSLLNDGFGTGHTNLYSTGSSNGSNTGALPIWISGSRFGVGTSNPAYEFDVNGVANASTLREGTTLLCEKYALSNTVSNVNSSLITLSNSLSNFSSNFVGYSNLLTPMSIFGSNAHSNYTTVSSFNGYSNLLTPMSIFGSNAHSNYTTLSSFNGFSNYLTPKTEWSSNALVNYQLSATDKYWTFTNSMVQTNSNVAINGQLNLATNSNATSLTVLSALDAAVPNAGTRKIMLGKANSNYAQAEITYKHAADGSTANSLGFGFTGVGADLMTLTVSGEVGIKNTSPTKALDVNGEGWINGNCYITGFSWLTGNVGIGTAPLLTTGSPKLIVDGTTQTKMLWVEDNTSQTLGTTMGWIDKGMTANTARLMVFGKSNTTNNYGVLGYSHQGDGSTNNTVSLGFYGAGGGVICRADGKVGIGTSSPGYSLDVSGDFRSTGNAVFDNAGIGLLYAWDWACFANSSKFSAGNYAVLHNGNSGQTLLNTASGVNGEFRQNNATVGWWNSGGMAMPNYYGTSDSNNKKNIQPLGRLLDKLDKIEGKSFEWKQGTTQMKHQEGKHIGLLAQDLQQLCPEVVSENEDGLCYELTAFNGVVIQLLKDLKNEIDDLKAQFKKK